MGSVIGSLRSRMMYNSPYNSKTVEVIALYSPSAKDLDTVPCFFVFHETNAFPMNIQNPVKLLLVSKQEPQFESQRRLDSFRSLPGRKGPMKDCPLDTLERVWRLANESPSVPE